METTDSMVAREPRRLIRTREGRWAGGVCSGLGSYFDVSPLVYRIAFVALTLAGGVGFLLYVAAWLVVPEEGERESIAAEALREHRDEPWLLLGVGLLALGGLLAVSNTRIWPATGSLWLAAVVAGAALVWWRRSARAGGAAPADDGTTPAVDPSATAAETTAVMTRGEPRPRRRSLFLPVLGTLIAVAGVLALLDALDVVGIDWTVVLAAGAVAVGIIVAVGALTSRAVESVALLGLMLLAAAAVGLAVRIPLSDGIGQRVDHPVTAAALAPSYRLGIGDLTVDLSDVPLAAGATDVSARLGVGTLKVIVPSGVTVQTHDHAGVGSVAAFGRKRDGASADQRIVSRGAAGDTRRLVLDASVGIGEVQVVRR